VDNHVGTNSETRAGVYFTLVASEIPDYNNLTMAEHDNSYKLLFSHAEMVRDLLLGFVRETWVKELDFSTLEKMSGSYVTDDIRDRHDDIIWRVKWGKQWVYVYLLLEFQSTIDYYMPVRIMTYMGLLYQDLIRTGQVNGPEKLPPVFPVVLYNGKPRWNAPVEISPLIEPVSGGLERYRPSISFLLLDEGNYQDEELKPLKNLVSALFRLEKSQGEEQLLEVVTSLIKWLASPEQVGLRRAFTIWFNRVLQAGPANSRKNITPGFEELTEVKTMLAETVKEWHQQWKEEGIRIGEEKGIKIGEEKGIKIGEKKGIKIGEKKGRKEGELSIFLKLLELKFGPVSRERKAKIHNAGPDLILKWSERILTAETLEDIFQDD